MVGAMLEAGALRDLPGARFGVPTNDALGSFSALDPPSDEPQAINKSGASIW